MVPRLVRPTYMTGAFTNQREVNITEIPVEDDHSQHMLSISNRSSDYGKANALQSWFKIEYVMEQVRRIKEEISARSEVGTWYSRFAGVASSGDAATQ